MKDANLKSLFESDLLGEEAKTVLKETWDTAIQTKEAELETTYATKLNEAKQEITSSMMGMIEEAINEEMALVADELTEARTLEVRYAEKLEEFKESYDEKLQEQMKSTVDEIIKEELDELKEDIEFAKKHQFVMDMFESYKEVYAKTFGETDFSIHEKLEEAEKEVEKYRRKEIIESLLDNVSGSKREVALTILEGVATDKLEAKFDSIRPVLLAESDDVKTDDDKEALNESDLSKKKVVLEDDSEETDDSKPAINEQVALQLARSLKLATRR